MKILTKLYELVFFIAWLGFTGFLTAVFFRDISRDIAVKGDSPWMYLVLILPVCFVLIGIWGVISSFGGMKNTIANPERPRAKTGVSGDGRVGAFLIGLPFFLMGLSVMIFFSIVPTVKSLSAAGWDRVPVEVVKSEIITNHSSDGNTYKPDVRFRYRYGGRRYESSRYDFISMSTSRYKSVSKKVASVPAGSRPLAYVNPRHPEEAVLSIRLSWLYLIMFLFGGVFAYIGGGIVFGVWFIKVKGKPAAAKKEKPACNDGPSVLKSRGGGPIGRFILVFIVTLIWNGVVYLLFARDAPALFKISFSVFGILMIVWAWHSFLALFNPRLRVEVDRSCTPLGESFQLTWRIIGKRANIKKFSITLNGQEEATYRRGTRTYTDHSVFLKQVVWERASGTVEGTGVQTIMVPKDTMYSWKSRNNKIVWFVQLDGVIDKWPDIKEEYVITVLPARG